MGSGIQSMSEIPLTPKASWINNHYGPVAPKAVSNLVELGYTPKGTNLKNHWGLPNFSNM